MFSSILTESDHCQSPLHAPLCSENLLSDEVVQATKQLTNSTIPGICKTCCITGLTLRIGLRDGW